MDWVKHILGKDKKKGNWGKKELGLRTNRRPTVKHVVYRYGDSKRWNEKDRQCKTMRVLNWEWHVLIYLCKYILTAVWDGIDWKGWGWAGRLTRKLFQWCILKVTWLKQDNGHGNGKKLQSLLVQNRKESALQKPYWCLWSSW